MFNLSVRDFTRNHFYKCLTAFDAYGSETGRRREKTAKISFDCRLKVQDLRYCIEACPAKSLHEAVRGHGSRVPVSRLYLIERIPDASVITLAACPNNFHTFVNPAQCNQMRCYLVLDSGPHFVRVNHR